MEIKFIHDQKAKEEEIISIKKITNDQSERIVKESESLKIELKKLSTKITKMKEMEDRCLLIEDELWKTKLKLANIVDLAIEHGLSDLIDKITG